MSSKTFRRWFRRKAKPTTVQSGLKSRYVHGEEKRRLLDRIRKANPVVVESAEGKFFIPEELTFAAPESPEFDRLLNEMMEYTSKPLPPQCPICAEERKGYACIFPPIPCPHGFDGSDTLTV